MADIGDLQKRVIEFRDARDWGQFHNPKDLAISLISEATELLDEFKWKTPEEIEDHLASNKDSVADEVVDVMFQLLIIAHDLEIDIQKEFDRKMIQNENKYPVEKSKGRHTKYTEL